MPIRVMIIDDSPFVRRAVRRMLATDPALEVVGEAADGASALRQLGALTPDVITLDLRMPGLDGVATLEYVMAERPTPVVLLSSYAQADAALTLRALAAGAVDVVDKSRVSAMDVYDLAPELVAKLKTAARSHLSTGSNPATPVSWLEPAPAARPELVVIGASTGGPRAIERVLTGLRGRLGAAVLVVQHMPAGYTAAFARRLDDCCEASVRELGEVDALVPGEVLVARGGFDVVVEPGPDGARARAVPGDGRALPRVDVALESAAACFGPATCAVILTGMGHDGVRGARAVRAAGGAVIAESAATCTVHGMPRAVVSARQASCVAPLGAIAGVLEQLDAGPGAPARPRAPSAFPGERS